MKERTAIDLTALDGSMIIEAHDGVLRLPKAEIAVIVRFGLDVWPDLLHKKPSEVDDHREAIRARLVGHRTDHKHCGVIGAAGLMTVGPEHMQCLSCRMLVNAAADLDHLLRQLDRQEAEAKIAFAELKAHADALADGLDAYIQDEPAPIKDLLLADLARKAYRDRYKDQPAGPLAIPMILHCPKCCVQHIDREEWATKLHKTHLCSDCGLEWRPAEIYTVGVAKLVE